MARFCADTWVDTASALAVVVRVLVNSNNAISNSDVNDTFTSFTRTFKLADSNYWKTKQTKKLSFQM